MAQVKKIDSNVTGLRYCVETALGTAGTTWVPLDPNSYNDFGGSFTKVARAPINTKRSRFKGVLTDLDAAGGFNIDMTQTNIQDLMPGFMFAPFSEKAKLFPTAVTAGTHYTVASSTGILANDLVFASGFGIAGNNGLKLVTSVTGTTVVCSGLTAEASPPAGASIVRVGHQFASADATITASGTLATLGATAKNLTQLGLVPGEFIHIGGDAAITQFANAANLGFARVRSVTATAVTLDKAEQTLVTDTGSGKTIQIFFGRVLKNLDGSNIVRTSYQLERTLGAPDDAQPTQIQSEYLVGAVPNELTMVIDTADKVNMDMGFMAINYETRTGVTGVKAGTRPALTSGKAFNTSSHFARIKMALVSQTAVAPTALFGYTTEIRLTINNNLSAAKAIGTLGAFEMTAGTFEVGGNVTAYFQDVTAIDALRNNSDVTFDIIAVKDNSGFAIDVPLVSLGDGRLNVELNTPITLPLSLEAADAGDVNSNLGHTILLSFFDYLPNAAAA